MTHVLIATPTAGGIVKAQFAASLAKVIIALSDAGWRADFMTVDGSYVTRARNYFAEVVLRQPQFSHLLMIDSDMAVEGGTVCRLLRADKPVIAAAYAQRRLDMEALVRAARNPELALPDLTAAALEYNIRPSLEPGSRQVRVQDGMCRVEHVALGCAAIRRDALETLVAAGTAAPRPDRFLQQGGLNGPFHGFFDEIVLEDGDSLSEDYSFCRRWRSIPGQEIWAVVDEPIGHVGDMVYAAPYLSRLLRGRA